MGSRAGRTLGRRENVLPLWGMEPLFLRRPACVLGTAVTKHIFLNWSWENTEKRVRCVLKIPAETQHQRSSAASIVHRNTSNLNSLRG